MTAIAVDNVSKHFRLNTDRAYSVKERVLKLGRTTHENFWALRDISLTVDEGETVGILGHNGSGKSTLLKCIAGILKPSSGQVRQKGRIASLLELGAGFHPDFTGRENVYLNGSLLGLSRRVVREHLDEIIAFAGIDAFVDLPVRTYSSGMAMRLGFAVAAHLDVDVLLLDEVFAVGDEEFQRKCFGKIFEFKQRGGTIVFVSHDASAVERLCERTVLLRGGRVEFDGPTHDAILRYHRQLAADRDPDERAAGLREWGSGEARIADVELLDADGESRRQFLAGESLALRLRLVADEALDPPRLVYELRGESGLLLAVNALDTREVGWERTPGELRVRFDVGHLPLADGRFTVRLGLSDPGGGRLYHQLDDAVSFLVYPGAEEGGLMRLEGTWSREEVTTAA